jgi:hypothetical protein
MGRRLARLTIALPPRLLAVSWKLTKQADNPAAAALYTRGPFPLRGRWAFLFWRHHAKSICRSSDPRPGHLYDRSYSPGRRKRPTERRAEQEITADSGHASFPLENLRFIDVAVKGASVVRVIRADSAGVPLLVVLVKRLPNPAGAPIAIAPNCGGQPGSRSASARTPPNTSSLPAFATRNLIPLQAPLPERSTVERSSSGLRAPAAIGTLITSGRMRLSRHYKIS